MTQMTIADLVRLLRACAGQEDGVDLDGDVADVEFIDLGYDSIALLEVASRVEREFGVTLDDGTVGEATTPAAFVALVNAELGSPALA